MICHYPKAFCKWTATEKYRFLNIYSCIKKVLIKVPLITHISSSLLHKRCDIYLNLNYIVFAGSASNGEQSSENSSSEAPSEGVTPQESQPVGDKVAYSR